MSTQHADTSLDIRIGTTAVCRDNSKGRVTRLVMEPVGRHVTHVIVQYGVPHHEVVVPIEQVTKVQDDSVVLSLDRESLTRFPQFAEVDYTLPDQAWLDHFGRSPGDIVFNLRTNTLGGAILDAVWAGHFVSGHAHRGVAPEEVPIGRGTRITCREGQIGRVDHVLVHPETDVVQALVARKGHLLRKDVIIPAAQVDWIAEDEIHIDADQATLEELPEYHPACPDEQITAEVQARLVTQEQTGDEPTIMVQTRDGVVRLNGVVRTEDAKRAAATVAATVVGVWEVENGLQVGRDLEQTVADALTHDARTVQAVLEATYSDGGLTLRGQVRSAREKAAAVEIAGTVAGVAAVIDELEIDPGAIRRSGPPPSPESLLAVAGLVGILKRL